MANILIVDDEKAVLYALQEELERAGHSIKVACCGKDALEIIEKEKFDIVYTDLIMPGMNGVELCKEIKKISPNTEVVLISGYAKKVLKHKLDFIMAGGSDEFLVKPLTENQLTKKTEKILNEVEFKKSLSQP